MLFNALKKTLPTKWKAKEIIVLEQVCISPPYTPESCKLIGNEHGNGAALDRVKKVVRLEREKRARG
jgi:hypothetical protein